MNKPPTDQAARERFRIAAHLPAGAFSPQGANGLVRQQIPAPRLRGKLGF